MCERQGHPKGVPCLFQKLSAVLAVRAVLAKAAANADKPKKKGGCALF